MIDILDYLKNGDWNKFKIGMKLSDFKKLFPSLSKQEITYFDETDVSLGFSVYLDGVEIMFEQDILYSIKFDFSHSFLIGSQFQVDNRTSPEEFLTILKVIGINWKFDSDLTMDKQLALRLESKVIVLFLFDKRLGLKLSKTQVFYDYYNNIG